MKKTIISMVVFVMLGLSVQASTVDNGIANVDNHSAVSSKAETFSCVGAGGGQAIYLAVVNNMKATAVPTVAKISFKENPIAEPYEVMSAAVTLEESKFFTKYNYDIYDGKTDAPVGTLQLVNKKIASQSETIIKPFKFCGRAGCDDEPIVLPPTCGRGLCIPKAAPAVTYQALLKLYEKEISFTCK